MPPAAMSFSVVPRSGSLGSKQSNEGMSYLFLKLDDPSFMAPIFANLLDDPDGES